MYCIVLCYTLLYSTVPYFTVLNYTVLNEVYCTLLCCTLLSSTELYCGVLWCPNLWNIDVYGWFRFGPVWTNQIWSCLVAELIKIKGPVVEWYSNMLRRILLIYKVPVKSMDTPTHSRVFLYLNYFLHCRIIVKTSKLWNNTYGIM